MILESIYSEHQALVEYFRLLFLANEILVQRSLSAKWSQILIITATSDYQCRVRVNCSIRVSLYMKQYKPIPVE